MSLLSLVINLIQPCWIKVFISLKRNRSDPKPLNGSIRKWNKALTKSSLHDVLLQAVMPQQPVFVLQQDLKTSRGLHEEMKKAASNNAKQVRTHFSLLCSEMTRVDENYNCCFGLFVFVRCPQNWYNVKKINICCSHPQVIDWVVEKSSKRWLDF